MMYTLLVSIYTLCFLRLAAQHRTVIRFVITPCFSFWFCAPGHFFLQIRGFFLCRGIFYSGLLRAYMLWFTSGRALFILFSSSTTMWA